MTKPDLHRSKRPPDDRVVRNMQRLREVLDHSALSEKVRGILAREQNRLRAMAETNEPVDPRWFEFSPYAVSMLRKEAQLINERLWKRSHPQELAMELLMLRRTLERLANEGAANDSWAANRKNRSG